MSLRTVAGETPQVVPLDQGLAADRLLGGDVVLDDGAQHLELAVVKGHTHLLGSLSDWHSPSRVPVYVAAAADAMIVDVSAHRPLSGVSRMLSQTKVMRRRWRCS